MESSESSQNLDMRRYLYLLYKKRYAFIFTAVSIICEDSGLADALSTTVYNMSLEDGKKLIESLPGVEAMWVMKDDELVYSSGFESYIKKDK